MCLCNMLWPWIPTPPYLVDASSCKNHLLELFVLSMSQQPSRRLRDEQEHQEKDVHWSRAQNLWSQGGRTIPLEKRNTILTWKVLQSLTPIARNETKTQPMGKGICDQLEAAVLVFLPPISMAITKPSIPIPSAPVNIVNVESNPINAVLTNQWQ